MKNIMKIEFDYLYRGKKMRKFIAMKEVINIIRTGKYEKSVNALREEISLWGGIRNNSSLESAEKIPHVVWSNSEEGYTGMVLLSLSCDNEEQLERLRRQVNEYLQVVCSFKGASGKSLKVVMAFDLATDGMETSLRQLTVDKIRLFHANAYHRAATFLLANTGISSVGKGAIVGGGCRISCDEDVFFNDKAMPIRIAMPKEMPLVKVENNRDIDELKAKVVTLPGYSETEMEVTRFNIIRRSIDVSEDDEVGIIALAEACAKGGLIQEIAVKCALSMNCFRDKTMLVRTSFERSYADLRRQGKKAGIPKNILNIQLMQDFLRSRYRFRQNEVTGSVEYAEISKYNSSWKPFSEKERNTMCMEAIAAGIEVWDKDILRFVNSTLIETYDPIAEWMLHLPQWDGRDRVGELADTVQSDWDCWKELFRIWLRSMVSQWRGINRMYGATMVLMFTGKQGTGKSTFMKRLLPPELSSYYVDRIDFTNKKEAERALVRFCLINLDEFDQISPRQTAFLKHILQKSDVSYRKMYQDDIEQRRRYATFCATTNSDTPLTDPTGSRRYLVVEVTENIDSSYEIDYPQLYAQVLSEIRHDMPTYFDREKESMIQFHNINYTQEVPLATMFENTFAVADDVDDCIEMTSTEILLELKEKYRVGIMVNKATATQLGRYLSIRGIRSITKNRKRVFRIRRL